MQTVNLQPTPELTGTSPVGFSELLCPTNFPDRPMNRNQQTIEPKTINKSRAISYGNEALVSPKIEVVNGLTRALTLNTAAVGKLLRIRNPEHRAKAEKFWSNLAANRKLPGHCSRCGKKHDGQFRQCDVCREKLKHYKARRLVRREEYDPTKAMAMIYQMRREVTKLREIIKQMHRAKNRKYQRDRKQRKTLEKYHDAYPTITKQELSTMSSAYDEKARWA